MQKLRTNIINFTYLFLSAFVTNKKMRIHIYIHIYIIHSKCIHSYAYAYTIMQAVTYMHSCAYTQTYER